MIPRLFRALGAALQLPWVVSLLVILLCVLLLWLVGPLVAVAGYVPLESPAARLAATLLLLLLWAAHTAFTFFRRRKKDAAEPDKATAREAENRNKRRLREELDGIRRRVKEAVKTVTSAGAYGSGPRSRYALPWYLLLGTAHCGKTSLLLRAGLHFPVNAEEDLHLYGINATEQCEVLYENEAVFFDTPGAYAESASGDAGHRLWKELLRRLFRARPARPLNGVILCVSMRDMLDADASRREHTGKTLRAKLDEALRSLRSRVPVYLVFTKCDAIPGFADFFAHLSRSEREQFFGRVAAGESMDMEEVRRGLRDMAESLALRIPAKMHQERDPAARGGIFRFPTEFAAIGPRLEDFMAETFGPSRYRKPVMFRGFFLTSALNPDNEEKAAPGNAPLTPGPSPRIRERAASGSFFLNRMFRDCIIPEARLAGADKEHIWGVRLRRYGAQIAAAGLFLLAVALLGFSFVNNQARLETLDRLQLALQESRRAAADTPDAAALLPELGQAEQSLNVYTPDADSFLRYGLGLYPGEAYSEAARLAYIGQLNARLLPLLRSLTANEVERTLDNPTELKGTLRAYLMLHDPERCDQDFIRSRLDAQWSALYPGRADVQEHLRRHAGYLMTNGIIPAEPDADLVDRARAGLLRVPLAERAYQRMREEAEESGRVPFTFRAAIGSSPFEGDERSIPPLYTREGYEAWLVRRCPAILRDLTDEAWVFGGGPRTLSALDMAKAVKDVRALYFREYILHWREAVQSLRVRTPGNLREARLLADQFSSGVSPAVLVLREVRANTTFILEQPGSLADNAAQAAIQAAGKKAGAAGKIIAAQGARTLEEQQAQATQEAWRDAEAVRRYFAPLDALLDEAGNPKDAVKTADAAMAKVSEYYKGFLYGDNVEQRILTALLDLAEEKDDTLRGLAGAAESLPPPVRGWYSSLVSDGLQRMLVLGASAINKAYKEKILNIYDERLRRHYPFAPTSKSDADLNDFTEFFRDGGTLDSFHESYLRPFIDRSGKLRSIMGQNLPIAAEAVVRMQRAMRVQDAFFLSGRELGIHFLMEPLAMDANLRQITLTGAGKKFSYSHEPAQGAAFSWPPTPGQSARASLETVDLNGVRSTPVSAEGDWALFRLLGGATIDGREGNRCRLKMYPGGKLLELLIQFRGKVNPFDPSICSFVLPESLL